MEDSLLGKGPDQPRSETESGQPWRGDRLQLSLSRPLPPLPTPPPRPPCSPRRGGSSCPGLRGWCWETRGLRIPGSLPTPTPRSSWWWAGVSWAPLPPPTWAVSGKGGTGPRLRNSTRQSGAGPGTQARRHWRGALAQKDRSPTCAGPWLPGGGGGGALALQTFPQEQQPGHPWPGRPQWRTHPGTGGY